MADVCLCLCARVHTRVAVSVLVCVSVCLCVCVSVCAFHLRAQSGACHNSTPGANDFHRASLNFYIPPSVSLEGRVWKTACMEVSTFAFAHLPSFPRTQFK